MGILSKITNRMNFKAKEKVIHPTGSSGLVLGLRKPLEEDMRKEIGTGLTANVVMSPIRWVQRNASEAPIGMRREPDQQTVDEHPAKSLLNKPNDDYAFEHLLAATIFSLETDGNAYWQIESGLGGKPTALYYTPHWMVEPKWPEDGSLFISHYVYNRGGGKKERLEVDEVIHFRNGINPENVRLGLSPLSGLLAEIWSDMEAGSFVGAILKNGGVPGLLFSPRGEANSFSVEDTEELKNYLQTQFSGAGKGRPFVSSVDSRLEQFGFDPKQLDLSSVRDAAEERVCAALGIPAAVVGFGTGMQQTKVGATMKELRKEAWVGGVIPLLSSMAGEINRVLLPLFSSADRLEVFFDTAKVPAMTEDQESIEKRAKEQLDTGAITVNEYRVMVGKEETPGQDVFLRNFSVIEVAEGTQGRTIEDEKGGPSLDTKFYTPEGEIKTHEDDGHNHTALERRLSESGRRVRKPPKQLTALADRIDKIREKGAADFEPRLEAFFDDLGKQAAASARKVLKKNLKANSDEKTTADRIIQGMRMRQAAGVLKALFSKEYLEVAKQTSEAVRGTIGLVLGVSDPVAQSIILTGGRRAGLIDISKQSRTAIFKTLVRATAEGSGPAAVARSIRDAVGSGPWSTPAIRAKVIARTEMAFATNVSSLELGKELGAEQAVVFDARLGSTDFVCEALNGAVVSLGNAEQLMNDEHPNGTRSFTPIPPTMKI